MTRSVRSFSLLALLAGASLAGGCATAPSSMSAYEQATRPITQCRVGSRICREVNPRTGQTDSPHPVITIQLHGETPATALKQLPFVY